MIKSEIWLQDYTRVVAHVADHFWWNVLFQVGNQVYPTNNVGSMLRDQVKNQIEQNIKKII